jgi:RimJ/RimL family protein N-acetyltransferase
VRLREIAEADLDIVRALRNESREWFFDNRVISREGLRHWFKTIANRPIDFFVLDEGGRAIGTISVATSADGKEIGNLLLDPAWRGRGLMHAAVAQLTTEPGRYFARVKPGNTASERVFLRCGFTAHPEPAETVFEKFV